VIEDVLTTIASSGAVLAGTAAALGAAKAFRDATVAAQLIRKSRPEDAISSLDLQSLGGYIYGTIGNVPIPKYAANPDTRRNVAAGLEAVERFLADDTAGLKTRFDEADIATSLRDSQAALDGGLVWESLARLRRSIEIELRRLAKERRIDVPARVGAGRLLRRLADAGVIPEHAVSPLSYVIEIANRAVHGEDVSEAEAEEALWTADHALRQIRDARPPSPER
jgi:hypothetical protein